MSRFKKIFTIIASVVSVLIISFLITVKTVKSNVSIAIGEPYSIVIFDHATTGTEINEIEQINKITNEMGDLTNLTVFDKLINRFNLEKKIYQDSENKYAKWSTDLLAKNLVVEIIYKAETKQDLVVYDGKDTRVISYQCLAFVIPTTERVTEIAVYYSLTSNTNGDAKNQQYRENTPLILYGNADEFYELAKTLKK